MSIRRINSTGRKKILREDAQIFLRSSPESSPAFDATLELTGYDLPSDANVFVEAYRQTTFMRFPYGTVATREPGQDSARRLTEFATGEGVLFRVKVTSAGDRAGILLAEADRIPVSDDEEQPEHRIALLPTLQQDLNQEIWRLDFSGAAGPLLLVNSRLGDWKAVATSPLFRSLVFPAAMRRVLWHVYKVEETRDLDDPTDWGSGWLRFAAALPGVGTPPISSTDDADWTDWIDDALDSFCRQHKLLDRFTASFAPEV